jgi:MYXO-CTERM domain-containing protein
MLHPAVHRAGHLSVSMAPALFAFALGCTAPTARSGDPPLGATRGELSAFIATADDGTSHAQYFLHEAQTERDLELIFEVDPELPSGTKLDVWGSRQEDRLRVTHFAQLPEELDPVAAIRQPAIGATPYKPRSFALAIVRIGTPPATPLSKDVALQRLMGAPANQPSVRQYYVEASYGRQDIAGDVFGPFDFPMPTGCMTSQLATALRGMIPGTYNHYLWYLEPRTANCQWSGLASSGTPERPSRDTWYNASSGCVVLMQEPGHNFGMQHSSAMKCGTTPFADDPATACTHNEYGDRYDPMGSGCRHMNSFQKAYQGWFDKCNVVEVSANGTFTLVPLELPCDGIQVLQVPMPKVRMFPHSGGGGSAATALLSHYFIELRAPIGLDKGLGPIVQIRVSSDIRSRAQRGDHSWFLDMDPTTTTLDGLAPGQSFTDPSGSPKITVVSTDGTKASVTVEFSGGGGGGMAAQCLDGTPLEGSGPGPESCAAAPSVPSGTPPMIPDGGPIAADGGGSGGGTRDGGRADSGGRADGKPASMDSAPLPLDPDAGAATGGAGGPAGTGGSGGGLTGGSGGGATAGAGGGTGEAGSSGSPEGHPSSVKGGCNCQLGGGSSGVTSLLGVAWLALLLRRRRR